MAKVSLRNAWFAPGGRYFHATEGNSFVEIPDDLVPYLPATGKVLDAPEPAPEVEAVSVTPDPDGPRSVRRRAPVPA